ncbi:unnamed protein product [Dicrocoelium dendriticum]|nr:unnamed protein product [Dicrocoelium dendriticum]CAH8654138.1 unnamed protein product [Dicrocoelium dendriticum]
MGDTVYASEEDTISKRQSDIYSWIKNKIENEGVQARNIIKYNVPVDAGDGPKRVPTMATRSDVLQLCPAIHGSRHTSGCGVSEQTEWSRATSPQSAQTPRSSVGSHSFDRCVSIRSVNTISSTPSSCSSAKPHRRFNAAPSTLVSSAARNARQTENEYRARTIDEIYSACETDESEMECKEVIMILEHSKQDFHSLIEKMNLLREYERADDQNKPSALAWDERTTLPDKPIMRQVLASAAMAAASPPLDTFISVPAHLTLDVNGHDSDGSGSWRSIVKVAPSRAANHMGFGPPSSGATSSNPLAHTPSLKLRDIHHLSHVRSGSDLTNSALSSQRDDVLDDTMDDDMIGAALDGELGTNVLYSEDEADDADNDDDDDTELVDIALSESNASEPKNCTRFSHSIPNSFLARRSPHGLDEDIEDPEDNTISRDLRQIDEAIATVTTAERMLTNRLGRAQCAEAALRRRLLAEDKTTSAHSSCQWRGHKKLGMKSSKVVRNAEHDGDTVEMNVNLLKGGVLLLPNDSVEDHSNLLIVNHTISSVDSGESDVAREVESVFSSKTNEFAVTPSIRHSRGATQSRRRQCCACACHETITSTASMTTSNGTSRSHKFKTPTVCAHSSGRVASSNLPVGRSQNTCPLRTLSDNRGSFPLEMLRQSNIVYYSPSGRSKTASDDCPVSEAAQPLSPRMDSTTMPTSVTHCSNDVNVGKLVSSNPHYMRAMVSPSMGVTAVETAKGLLFLSEMSAKSRTPGHGVQMHEKLSARSARK